MSKDPNQMKGPNHHYTAEVDPYAHVSDSVHLGQGVIIRAGTQVSPGVQIGRDVKLGHAVNIAKGCHIGRGTSIESNSELEENVFVGPNVTIWGGALLMEGARICPNKVRSVSRNGRELGNDVSVGPGVVLPDEVELGANAIVPSQRTVAHIGALGAKNRVITIYGTDNGPLVSVGCQIGITTDRLRSRVAGHVNSTEDSAMTYAPYLDILDQIGLVVQGAYDRESALIGEIKDQRSELGLTVATPNTSAILQ